MKPTPTTTTAEPQAGASPQPASLRIDAPPALIEPELEPLLGDRLVPAWTAAARLSPGQPQALRTRLLQRVAASGAAGAAMVTARAARIAPTPLAPGVTARLLYAAQAGRALRPGEPRRARLIALEPGATWSGPAGGLHREWLVLRGSAAVAGQPLQLRDYHVQPRTAAGGPVASAEGALLFLRECELPFEVSASPVTVRDAEAPWPSYASGIRRRVLWLHEGQAALLYHAEPGASVPMHTHGHDEECLMVQGELFLDDTLLEPGDYQLAPAGTGHRITTTDTGVVLYAHGDLDLRFVT